MAELTDEQIAAEKAFMEGVPRFNLAAFLIPFIWGPANGIWVTILYYPAWLFVDNLLYSTFEEPSVMAVVASVSALVIIIGVSVAFSLVSQPYAWHRAHDRGKTKQQYLKEQRYWAVGAVIAAVVVIALATIYNLAIRPGL